jgi:hypothetical protein
MRRVGLNNCPYCGKAEELYSSRPKTWRDEWCLFFFLQVVRCHSCMRRHYRPLFLQAVPVWSETEPVETIANGGKGQRQS